MNHKTFTCVMGPPLQVAMVYENIVESLNQPHAFYTGYSKSGWVGGTVPLGAL